jgi:probable HAF family extracellular repeat protein
MTLSSIRPNGFTRGLARGIAAISACMMGMTAIQAAPYTWVDLNRGNTTPPNVVLSGNAIRDPATDPAFAVRLVEFNAANVDGHVVVNRPAGVPAHAFKYFTASFRFLAILGNGGEGFSFNYGPNTNDFFGGKEEEGSLSGLAVSFDLVPPDGFPGPDRIVSYYNTGLAAWADGSNFWDANFNNRYGVAVISYGASGLNITVTMRDWNTGAPLQTYTLAQNLPIAGWNPQSSWKFFFGARNSTLTSRIALSSINLTTDSEPPSFAGIPSSRTTPEDTAFTIDFTVDDREDPAGITLTASAPTTGPILTSGLAISNLGGNARRLTVTPVANAFGSTTITLQATQDGDTTTVSIPVTVTSVNDLPVITASAQTINEDSNLNMSFGVSDADTSLSLVNITVASSNPAVLPPGNIQISGTGSTRNLTAQPLPHANGTTTVTLTANDGAGGIASTPFTVQVNAINDLPVAGSPFALQLDGINDYAIAPSSGLSNGDVSHSIESWVNIDTVVGRSWLLHVGTPGTGHHWALNSHSPTEAIVQFGAWSQGSLQVGTTRIPLGRWIHLATTYDAATKVYILYLDGTEVGRTIGTATEAFNLQAGLTLGRSLFFGDSQFDGSIDELRIWNRVLTPQEIQGNLARPLTGRESGLVEYLRFDEGQSVVAFNTSRNSGGSPATLFDGATWQVRHDDYGVRLDGNDDVVTIPHASELNAFPLTASAWVRTTSNHPQAASILNKYQDASANGYSIHVRGGQVQAWFFQSAGNAVYPNSLGLTGGTINDGLWHHVTLVVDATGGRLFVDGTQRDSAGWIGTPGAPTTTVPLRFGQYPSTFPSSNFLPGTVADVSIWNRSFTAAEVRDLQRRRPVPNEAGLVAYWPLDSVAGTLAKDLNLTPLDGTLSAGASYAPANLALLFGRQAIPEDTTRPIFIPALDVELERGESSSFTFTILTSPANGTLSATSGSLSNALQNPVQYTPTLDYNGPDSFRYRVTDTAGATSEGTVQIDVNGDNDLPTISSIANIVIEENTTSGPIPFILDDADHDEELLQIIVTSDSPSLIPSDASSIVVSGTGANRTIEIIPTPNEVGTAQVTLTVSDPLFGQSQEVFKVRVEPKPAYALFDLGTLSDPRNNSFGAALNDQGWAVGWAQTLESPQDDSSAGRRTQARAFLRRGLGSQSIEDLGTLGSDTATRSRAHAISRDNVIAGFANASGTGLRQAFRWTGGTLSSVANLITAGNDSIGYGLNESGDMAGSFLITGVGRRAFRLTASDQFLNLGVLPQGTVSEAFALNAGGTSVGYSTTTDGVEHAFRYTTSLQDLGTLPNHHSSRAYGINDDGLIVGWSRTNAQPGSPRLAFLYDPASSPSMRSLGLLTNGNFSEAYSINAFGQVVGDADRRLDNATTESRAFLYSAGQMRDLSDLIHDSRDFVFRESTWKLTSARAINRGGAIVGTGLKDGRSRAFLAVPAWVIGRQIPRPENAVPRRPEISIIAGAQGDTRENSFHWSDFEKRLYPIRPVTATIRWFTSEVDFTGEGTNIVVNTDRITVEGMSVWPQEPLIHVASAPVQVEPQGVPFNFGFQSVIHETTGGSARYDATSKTFNSTAPGYSVLYYLETAGANPNPLVQRPRFEVARTYPWNTAPTLQESVPAIVGTPVEDTGHQEYLERTGHVLFPNAFYDGVGPDRAHDRPSRLGPIIPVNREPVGDSTLENDLIVVWYRFSPLGVPWASVPVRYSIDWPDDANPHKIIIASGTGSGPLPTVDFPNKRVYIQTETNLPGYNPNEEHALIVNNTLYALRNDLNAVLSPERSRPFALLKFKNPTNGLWNIRPYKVVAEEAPYFFTYEREAGSEIAPPAPLFSLPLTRESHGVAGPYWEDYLGRLYGRAAGPDGTSTNVVIRWFYPMQPDFFYDLDANGTPDIAVGASIPWLDRRPANALSNANAAAGVTGVPIDVTYRMSWPRVGTLQVGQTLLNPRDTTTGKLPGVKNMANLQFVYDDLTPDWNPLGTNPPPILTLARLFDPISTRSYPLEPSESIPAVVRRISREGKEFFADLPPTLIDRVSYDPGQRVLQFSGVLDEISYLGEPLLLPNVLSSRERDGIRNLVPESHADRAAWVAVVDKLYDLTRNPNQVDLQPLDGKPDSASDTDTNTPPEILPMAGLRLGLRSEYLAIPGTNSAASSSNNPPLILSDLSQVPTNYVVASTNVVPEPLGSSPKTLTTALGGVPSASFDPLQALQFPGTANDYVSLPEVDFGTGAALTLEMWARPTGFSGGANTLIRQGGASPDWSLEFRSAGTQLAFVLNSGGSESTLTVPTAPSEFLNAWRHIAATYDGEFMRILVDGRVLSQIAKSGLIRSSDTAAHLGVMALDASTRQNPFAGALDEIRLWRTALPPFVLGRDAAKRLFGDENLLVRYYRADGTGGTQLLDSTGGAQHGTLVGQVTFEDSTAPTGVRPRHLTLVENNDPALGALPVTLHIIRVDDGPYLGDMKAIYPGNVFDQRLTLRHSSEFGGDPDAVEFEWYYKPDSTGLNPREMPATSADGSVTDSRGWIPYTFANRNLSAPQPPRLLDARQGVNDITLGEGGESSLLSLGDTWFICRYRGYNVRGVEQWSEWIGDPAAGGTPSAMLAEGWIKRVIRGLNQFDARVKDFHSSPSATYASLILQAGGRYEGDIAFNPTADNLNSVGLIESYTTVLNRGRRLSIDQGQNFDPANKALLLAAGRIADLYMLLGNEAYADAADPTIGFTTGDGSYSAQATSIFAFQNQLDSLIEEELALLRGRDDSLAGVAARPVYNRLLWNFTLGEGEIAYQRVYNIGDQTKDGFIDERDARTLYPQGHGDAWGHYLTAIKTYYTLLQHTNFTWVPQAEAVLVGGQPVSVDYLDERKFAQAAAARAKAGRDIVDLTYRANYVEDPAGQWQGYKDTKLERSWGVDEWGRRAGQGAYFDWLTANAILPAVDPDPTHFGIQKIDRTTVLDLDEIRSQFQDIQSVIDAADGGLNPVGLAKGAIVFDIDPTFLAVGSTAAIGRQAVQGLAHFEQLNERAIKMLKNAARVWDEANKATESLRQNQDNVDDFTRNVDDEERDYKNRLIEIFGYPHAGNIGPGKTYPSGYDGPDLYFYNYLPVAEVTGTTAPPSDDFIEAVFSPLTDGGEHRYHFTTDLPPGDPAVLESEILPVLYPISTSSADWIFETPASWGARRAPGEIQEALSEFLQANTRLKVSLQNYDGLVLDIKDQLALLQAQRNLKSTVLGLRTQQIGTFTAMNATLAVMNGVETHLRRVAGVAREVTEAVKDGLPKVVGLANDVAFFPRAIMSLASVGSVFGLETVADGLSVTQNAIELSKELAGLGFDLSIEGATQDFEIEQRVKEIEHLIRDEYNLRLEAFNEAEVVRQTHGKYLAKLAEGERVIQQRLIFRRRTAASATELRYRDAAFRIFRNEAVQKYRATFDMAARYVYLSATAYDYESNFLGTDQRAGRHFLTQIIRQRNLGVLVDGEPIPGQAGLADVQGRMLQNWEVLEPQFGLNNPQLETANLSLRNEFFRMKDQDTGDTDDASDVRWRAALNDPSVRVKDLWQVPEFRRFCRPFASERLGPQPGLVLRMPTTVTFGLNFFGWPLSGGDTAFDPSHYSTKINYAGITFPGYDEAKLSKAPRVYLFPTGMDTLRSPTGNDLATREWRVLDQALPHPFAIGANDLSNPGWIPQNNLFGEPFTQIRRFASLRGYPIPADFAEDPGFDESGAITSSRLVGRSVWNTQWVLIIPGGTLLDDPEAGINQFIQSVTDIRIGLAVYSFPGN